MALYIFYIDGTWHNTQWIFLYTYSVSTDAFPNATMDWDDKWRNAQHVPIAVLAMVSFLESVLFSTMVVVCTSGVESGWCLRHWVSRAQWGARRDVRNGSGWLMIQSARKSRLATGSTSLHWRVWEEKNWPASHRALDAVTIAVHLYFSHVLGSNTPLKSKSTIFFYGML